MSTILCPHCKQDTGIDPELIDQHHDLLTCPKCQQKIYFCPVSRFRCQVFGDEFDATNKERLDQCNHCLERTDTITCSHLDLIP